jgi:hypothetical protein
MPVGYTPYKLVDGEMKHDFKDGDWVMRSTMEMTHRHREELREELAEARAEIVELREDVEYGAKRAQHWHQNHNHQVNVKRRLSANYARLLRARHAGLIGRFRKACGR